MKQKECIVLAGGFGTRLQTVVADVPKCMAPINRKPFLKYLLDYLVKEGFNRVILSLGYKSEIVIDWLKSCNYEMQIEYVVEKEPLGTGGAIKYAATKIYQDAFFVFNGDTYFDIDSETLLNKHIQTGADISIGLKHLYNIQRYGTVNMGVNNRIKNFIEKRPLSEGLINGGIYILNRKVLDDIKQSSFSFEKEILEKEINQLIVSGYIFNCYFIDIGVPEDYQKMNLDFSK